MVTDKLNLKTTISTKIKTKYFIITLFLIFTCIVNAQVTISGKVITAENKPLELVEVILLTMDNVAIKNELTDSTGHFKLKTNPGNYKIQIRQIGESLFIKELEAYKDINLGDIIVTIKENLLQEITIISQKKLIERKVDRIVFNVESSIVANGGDGLDVLRVTPNIDMSNGVLNLIGKNRLGVMVNGRFLNLSGDNLENYLKSIRSDNISKIEVITTPPAKYDAEGNSGLINIILKRNQNLGYRGGVSTAYTQRTYASFSPNLNISYKSNRLDVSGGLSNNKDNRLNQINRKFFFQGKEWLKEDIKKNESNGITADLMVDYSLSSNMNVGLLYNGDFWNTKQKANNLTEFISNSSIDSTMTTPLNSNNKYDFNTITGYYEYRIDTIGKRINMNIDLFKKKNITDTRFNSRLIENNVETENTDTWSEDNSSYSAKNFSLDIYLPLKFAEIEFGSKLTYIKNKSDILIDSESLILSQNLYNQFDYFERTRALHISMNKNFKNKFSVLLGLRYENTFIEGNSISYNLVNSKELNNFFPSLNLSYNHNENNVFSLSFSKRIERPGFSSLNPFRTYSDNFSYVSGNPFLLPSYTYNIEFGYVLKNNLSITIYGSKLIDGQDYVTLIENDTNSLITKPLNYFMQKNIGLNISHSLDVSKCINSYNGLYLTYLNTTSNLTNITMPSLEGYSFYFTSKNNIHLDKNKKILLLANYFHSFPSTYLFTKTGNRASFDIGIRKFFLNKDMQLSMMVNDVFGQNRNNNTTTYPDFIEKAMINNDMRYFNITLLYKFGNDKLNVKQKNNNNSEEKTRSMF